MTLSFQEQSRTGGAIVAPCCGCSDLRDLDIVQRKQKTQVLWINLSLLLSFFTAEIATGLWSHSLSLLADAEHLVSDVAALGLTLLACWLAQRRPAGQATFAYGRVEVLVALVNGLSLFLIAIFIAWEAIERIQTPEVLLGLPMLIGAGIGLVVNSLNICLLHQHSHNDINLRGAFLHMVADAISSVGVIVAALAVYFLNWSWIDPMASLFVAGLTALGAIPLVKESIEILMEYAPRSIKPTQVTDSLKSFPGVCDVEKLYIWTITSNQVMLSAHLIVESFNSQQRDRLLNQLQAHLKQEYGISESILQLTSRDRTPPVSPHPLLSNNLVDLIKL